MILIGMKLFMNRNGISLSTQSLGLVIFYCDLSDRWSQKVNQQSPLVSLISYLKSHMEFDPVKRLKVNSLFEYFPTQFYSWSYMWALRSTMWISLRKSFHHRSFVWSVTCAAPMQKLSAFDAFRLNVFSNGREKLVQKLKS